MRNLGRNFDALSSNKGKEKNQDNIIRNPTLRRLADGVKNTKGNEYHKRIPRKKYFNSTSRKYSSPMYQSIFLGNFYSCSNFGHMEKDCREYHKDIYGPCQSPRINFTRRSHDSSFMNNMECLNFHKIGHIDHDCNLTWVPKQAKAITSKLEKKVTQVWRRKQIGLKISWSL